MSGDETMVMLVSMVVAGVAWYRWYAATRVKTLAIRNAGRSLFAMTPPICFALLFTVLRLWAADDVRYSGTYLAFYMFAGAAWIGFCALWLGFLGISPRDDVIERRNLAAAFAISGAVVGLTFCFAGANIGNGPGWWVVAFSAGLATIAFFGLWTLVERLTAISELVTIDRSVDAGLQLGGLLIAMGMILGRAVAGDWVSAAATVRDFALVAWPVLPLALLAVVVERVQSPDASHHEGESLVGLFVAMVYLAIAGLYVFVWQGHR
jgi:uncharacterized membrane protein YjfL (UPF0719 family)